MLRAPILPTLRVRYVTLLVGLLAMLVATLVLPGVAAAQTASKVVVPVTGKLSDGGTFVGRIVDPKVSFVDTEKYTGLKVSGTLKGTATLADNTTQRISQEFSTRAVLEQQARNCKILELDIGRIHLDVLGLVVDLAPIHLDVTAVPGAGNLLGNLLCAIAGLLDPNSALADFLNGLLAALFTA